MKKPLTAVCLTCRQTNQEGERLRQINRYLKEVGVKPVKNSRPRYQWGHISRCRYGIPCEKLRRQDIDNDRLAASLEPYIAGLVLSGDRGRIQRLLQLLRGTYPAVYRAVEKEAAMAAKEETENE